MFILWHGIWSCHRNNVQYGNSLKRMDEAADPRQHFCGEILF